MLPVDIHDKKLLPTNPKEIMKQNCVIYCRVSSIGDRQSNERQLRDLEEYAKSRSLIVAKTYEEKISGAKKNDQRPVLLECLDYCFSNSIGLLLISELSRLGRNVDEVLKNVMLCKEKKLNIYFQKEGLSIFDDTGKESPFLTIFIAVLGTCAQMERENIQFRLESGYRNYREKGGKVGRKPGTVKSEETKRAEYKEVISLLKRGYSVRNTAQLTGFGISTVQRVKNQFINTPDNET